MSDIAINQVLAQMRAMSTGAASESVRPAQDVGGAQFADLMGQSLAEVNASMQASRAMQTRFESGDPSVSLAEVMVTAQKASLQFTGMTEVRNKLLNAYQEVMNMSI
jgi:flagellar hook-basal body complex protein FliE